MRIRSREIGTSLAISAHRKRLTRRVSPSHELGTATNLAMSGPLAPLPPALPVTRLATSGYATAAGAAVRANGQAARIVGGAGRWQPAAAGLTHHPAVQCWISTFG